MSVSWYQVFTLFLFKFWLLLKKLFSIKKKNKTLTITRFIDFQQKRLLTVRAFAKKIAVLCHFQSFFETFWDWKLTDDVFRLSIICKIIRNYPNILQYALFAISSTNILTSKHFSSKFSYFTLIRTSCSAFLRTMFILFRTQLIFKIKILRWIPNWYFWHREFRPLID